MSISLASLRSSRDDRPPRVLLYGVEGVGKTKLAASAPDPVFIWTEEGSGKINVQGFPVAETFQDVFDALCSLYTEQHPFRTVVIDTASALEQLIWQDVCREHQVAGIEHVMKGFGKGYIEAIRWWERIRQGLEALRNDKGMNVILIAHADVKRFEDPEHEAYDQYQISVNKHAAALFQKHCDITAFMNYRVTVKREDGKFGSERARGIGSGERVLHLERRPAWIAKNRYDMPASIPIPKDGGWDALAPYFPQPTNTTPEPAQPATDAPAQPEEETEHATA